MMMQLWRSNPMSSCSLRRLVGAVLTCQTFCLSGAGAAEPDYRLGSGDVLEMSVAGMPDLRQKVMVEVGGEVSLPLVGRVPAAGLLLPDVQAAVKRLVAAKPIRQKGQDGRDVLTVLSGDDVNLTIAEYRPIYITGDVAKPGEQLFRPGMTVRQAVSLAGGYDIMRFRLVNPFLESSDLRATQETLWTEIAKSQAQIARLKAELVGKPEFDRKALAGMPVAPAVLQQVADIEAEHLTRRLSDLTKERGHLTRLVRQADEKLTVLREQQRTEDEGTQQDTKEYEQFAELNRRGTSPIVRVMEARRALLLSSTRLLQTRVQLEQARKEQAEAARSLERLDEQRRVDLLKELQEANVAMAVAQARLKANTEKVTHTSLLKSQLVRGRGSKVGLTLFRTGGTEQPFEAEEGTLLRPGDTVEVRLQSEHDVERLATVK